MNIFNFGLEWNSISLAQKVQDEFVKRKLTNKKGEKLYDHNIVMGFTENFSESAFIIEGFDHKNKFGIVITIPNKKKEVKIMAGKFNDEATMDAKYNETFTDLRKASNYFEQVLSEYDKEVKK